MVIDKGLTSYMGPAQALMMKVEQGFARANEIEEYYPLHQEVLECLNIYNNKDQAIILEEYERIILKNRNKLGESYKVLLKTLPSTSETSIEVEHIVDSDRTFGMTVPGAGTVVAKSASNNFFIAMASFMDSEAQMRMWEVIEDLALDSSLASSFVCKHALEGKKQGLDDLSENFQTTRTHLESSLGREDKEAKVETGSVRISGVFGRNKVVTVGSQPNFFVRLADRMGKHTIAMWAALNEVLEADGVYYPSAVTDEATRVLGIANVRLSNSSSSTTTLPGPLQMRRQS